MSDVQRCTGLVTLPEFGGLGERGRGGIEETQRLPMVDFQIGNARKGGRIGRCSFFSDLKIDFSFFQPDFASLYLLSWCKGTDDGI